MTARWLGSIVLVLTVGCGGDEGSECRATAECQDGLECAGPSEPQACGIPPLEGCSRDADCFAGTVCHATDDACSPDGIGAECRPPCSDGGCGEGFACDPDRGACVAIPCDAGFVCASHEVCEPVLDPTTPVHAQTHGCAAIECESDDACPSSTACVNAICQTGLGACVVPQVVP